VITSLLLLASVAVGQDSFLAHGDSPRLPPYQTALRSALHFRSSLVVGVRTDPPTGPWVSVRIEHWGHWGGTDPFLIISKPVGNDMIWQRDMPTRANSNDILRILNPAPKKASR
jgi:hypothetical protein